MWYQVGVLLVLLKNFVAPSQKSALEEARSLTAPVAEATSGGDLEGSEFWDQHDELLQKARREWGRRYPELYEYTDQFADQFLDEKLVHAIANREKQLLASLFEPVVPGVYRFQLFTPEFCDLLQQELKHHEESGIPQRRPNGMNRFGAILSDLGFAEIMDDMMNLYLIPISRHLFADYVGPNDLVETYPFTVKYKPGQDVKLDPHSDAATVTVNVCLLEQDKDAKVLYFADDREPAIASKAKQFVALSNPGEALIHLGQLRHGIAPIEQERHQLVIWMFGEHDYVRIAKYEPDEVRQHKVLYDLFWKRGVHQEL